jgi:SAM-dependent methyltransferase
LSGATGESVEGAGAVAAEAGPGPRCRFCDAELRDTFVDLGMSPLANAYLEPGQLRQEEHFYPLHAFVCAECLLVQLEVFESREGIFSDYAYFSSYSDSWLRHAREYVTQISERLELGEDSFVVELASNDGYLLQYFQERGVPVLGVEPARNVAEVANEKGIPTIVEFFGRELARRLVEERGPGDLVIGNNVLAHVPDLNDFVSGIGTMLAPDGVVTMEFPHLMRLIRENQFDTIYHEHFSYFSFGTVEKVFAAHGMVLFDVEEIPTHGGSLRIYGRPDANGSRPVGPRVEELRTREARNGLDRLEGYLSFQEHARRAKRGLLAFLVEAKEQGKSIVGYGAAAKGNTLLNYCGVRTDFVDYVADRSPHKQGRYLPGTHIPIHGPDRLAETRPDYVLILPWNLKAEVTESMAHIREWGGKFVVPIPEVEIL